MKGDFMDNFDNIKIGIYTYKGEEHDFNFYTNIDVIKKSKFVNNVVSTIVNDKSYQSVLRNVIFDFEIIRTFTDVFVNSEIADNNYPLHDVVDFVQNTEVANIVKMNADFGLIAELNKAVDLDIEYRTGIRFNPVGDALVSLMNTIENKISEADMDEMIGFAQMMTSMSDDFSMEKLIDAYGKSDMFKQIREQADERNAAQVGKIISIAKEHVDNEKT